ncbi:MAG: SurA N-terminal domain-containing protein [Endomicrobiaceae bacterium]|nr:SurA N-terminal domain-containing protein [Endomicrobiaceae bacterium]MDD3923119.1 SurA N-terminal domain-containing protein [Endomicrobiaceae bacterium]
MTFLIKHKVKIFLITILGFLAGSFVGFGSYLFGEKTYYDTVAVVNGYKIPYKTYYALYNNTLNMMRQTNKDLSDDMSKKVQNDILRNLVQDEIIWQQTKYYGISVSDEELALDIQNYPYFLNEKGQFDSRYYFTFLNNMRLSPKDFESLRRKQLASNKLQVFIASASKITDSEFEELHKLYPNVDDNTLIQMKMNEVLNDWFENIRQKTALKITMEGKE